MTTSGFLSPSREGKLPESRLIPFPSFKVNSSQPSSSFPTIPPEVKGESHQPQRPKKSSQKIFNSLKEKGKNNFESINSSNNNTKNEDSKVKKPPNLKEMPKIKAFKTTSVRESNQKPRLKKASKIKDKSKLLNTIFDKPVQASSTHSKYSKNTMGDTEKLTTEPDKLKLNIFKKISKVKDDKNNESSGHPSSKSNNPITSRPNSTIVSSEASTKPETKSEVINEKPYKPVFFKPAVEKKQDSVNKSDTKNNKQELNPDVPKKRKKKQKSSDDFNSSLEPTSNNTGTKKSKNKHDSDVYSAPSLFSFFGHLQTGPGLLPTGPTILPPSLASNPLVPKYTAPNSVLPILDKGNATTPMMYLPLPGENDIYKSDFNEPSITSEVEKIPTEQNTKDQTKTKVYNFHYILYSIILLFIFIIVFSQKKNTKKLKKKKLNLKRRKKKKTKLNKKTAVKGKKKNY